MFRGFGYFRSGDFVLFVFNFKFWMGDDCLFFCVVVNWFGNLFFVFKKVFKIKLIIL